MGGQPLRLGPFVGGLNTASDPTAIADAELADCTNFELDIDGSLVSRCPINEIDGHINWTERVICICEATFNGTSYLIGSNTNGVFQKTASGGAWTLITNTFRSTAAVQYANSVYIVAIPGSANPGGKWDPVGGFTAVAAIPKGMACAIHKERLFVCPGVLATTNASRLIFSNAGNFDTWTGTDFIDVKQGDGTNLLDLTVFQDNLILFKNKSTHFLAYDTRPTDAVLREISRTIGVDRQFCLVNYENQIYIFHGGWVYEIINLDFNRLNTKVPFKVDDTVPVGTSFSSELVFLSILEDRLICRFHHNIYVYGLRTRTWTQWESLKDKLHYFGPIVTVHASTGNEYYAGYAINQFTTTVQFFNVQTTTTFERTIDVDDDVVDTYTRTVSNGWGTNDTGQTYSISGGANSDYSVNGTKGIINLNTVNVARFVILNSVSRVNWDITHTVASNKIAAGSSIQHIARARIVDANNFYQLNVDFGADSVLRLALIKFVAGVVTTISLTSFGSYVANEVFGYRFYLNGSTIKAKIWRTVNPEPGNWFYNFTDTGVTAAGGFNIINTLAAGNTNTFPVTLTHDTLNIGDPSLNTWNINCRALTKNFDMAVSHEYKRLWWWGVDVTTNNTVTGTATPIVVSFTSTWSQVSTKKWNELLTWGSVLSGLQSIVTNQAATTTVARRFAKFLKGLRYRQINFRVDLSTDGSTQNGPARLFTMTIITETRETVTKGVN